MTHKQYLAIAIPFIISTITTPLLGAVDTGVMGRLPDPAFIGGVAIGVVIFNTIYWLFSFLRVSTTVFSSQALGARDDALAMWSLVRPLAIALVIGLAFILLQNPILNGAFTWLHPDDDVRQYAEQYFSILIWGAPLVLSNYVLLGWLMGQMCLRASLFLQVTTNVINIILCILFVMVFKWGVTGVAYGTLIAQSLSVVMGIFLVKHYARFDYKQITWKEFKDPVVIKKIIAVNGDLVIRTICLLAVTNMFMAESNSFGKHTLASNAIILQIQYLMGYFFDGFANASSVVSGKAFGSRDSRLFNRGISLSLQWCLYGSIGLSLLYALSYTHVFNAFTVIPEVVELGKEFSPWMIIFPFCASGGLVFYGVFSGATQTAPIRNSMILSLLSYVVAQYVLIPIYGNHGLILSFLIFSFGRTFFLGLCVPSSQRIFIKNNATT